MELRPVTARAAFQPAMRSSGVPARRPTGSSGSWLPHRISSRPLARWSRFPWATTRAPQRDVGVPGARHPPATSRRPTTPGACDVDPGRAPPLGRPPAPGGRRDRTRAPPRTQSQRAQRRPVAPIARLDALKRRWMRQRRHEEAPRRRRQPPRPNPLTRPNRASAKVPSSRRLLPARMPSLRPGDHAPPRRASRKCPRRKETRRGRTGSRSGQRSRPYPMRPRACGPTPRVCRSLEGRPRLWGRSEPGRRGCR